MIIIGHRGASGYKPENTLASFQKALDLGVDVIEVDVFTIKTGEVVIFHDETVDRTTNGSGDITQFSFEQLRQLDAGQGQKIPLLTEALDLIDKKVRVNIELKGPGTAKPVAKILRHYISHKGWQRRQFLVSSFNHHELRTFAATYPRIYIGTLYDIRPTDYTVLPKEDRAFSTNLDATFITETNVRDAHARGLRVFAHTVNTRHEAERMEMLGVDGIFTDFPDRVQPQPVLSTATVSG